MTSIRACEKDVLPQFKPHTPSKSAGWWTRLLGVVVVLCAARCCGLWIISYWTVVELGRCLAGPRPPFCCLVSSLSWWLPSHCPPTHPRPSRESNQPLDACARSLGLPSCSALPSSVPAPAPVPVQYQSSTTVQRPSLLSPSPEPPYRSATQTRPHTSSLHLPTLRHHLTTSPPPPLLLFASLSTRLHTCVSLSPVALGKGHGASAQASGVVVSLDRFMCDARTRPAPPGEFQPFSSAHPSTDALPLP